MSNGHARLGPSNHRWPNCPGSVREEADYPDIAGAAAIDGTGSHELLELCLKNNVMADSYLGQIIAANHEDQPNGWLVEEDRVDRVNQALNYVLRRVKELKEWYPGCEVKVESETKSDPGGAFGRDDWWGTCDITIIAFTGDVIHFVEVCDYKDGRNYVTVKDNTQLISYLFGKMRPYIASGKELVRPFKAEKVGGCRMSIVQPKTNPSVRYQCSTVADDNMTPSTVIKAAEDMATVAIMVDQPDAPCIPGKHCQWCKANVKRKGHCTAQSDEVVSNMTIELDESSLFTRLKHVVADPKGATAEELADLSDIEDALKPLFKALREEVSDRVVEMGDTVPGFAMKAGKSARAWSKTDEEMVEILKKKRFKGHEIYPQKLISPAALEKLSDVSDKRKNAILDEYCETKDGASTLTRVARVSTGVDTTSTDDVKSADKLFKDVPVPPAPKAAVPPPPPAAAKPLSFV